MTTNFPTKHAINNCCLSQGSPGRDGTPGNPGVDGPPVSCYTCMYISRYNMIGQI